MSRGKIFALYEKGVWIGDYRTSDAASYIGVSTTSITNAALKNKVLRGKYSLKHVDDRISKEDPLWKEFNHAVKQIAQAGERTGNYD